MVLRTAFELAAALHGMCLSVQPKKVYAGGVYGGHCTNNKSLLDGAMMP